MRPPRFFRWVLYILGGLIAGILLILVVLAFVPIKIDLSEHKGALEAAATRALGRTVKVEDKIVITTSLQPYLSLEGLRIGNPKGFQDGDFLQVKNAGIQVRVLPLLRGKLHLSDINLKGLSVLLVENEKGAVNWSFSSSDDSSPKSPSQPQPQSEKSEPELESDSLVLEKLVLEDISVDYRRPGMTEPLQFKIEKCNKVKTPGKHATLSMSGMLLKEPYTATVEIGSLRELLEENRSWMEIKMVISKTRFDFAGAIDLAQANKSLNLKAAVAGDRLDSLNGLLSLDLPPLQSYRVGAQLTLQKKRAELLDFVLQVGQSKLVGKMNVDKSGGRPKSTIKLSAPLIQLNDFDVAGWSPQNNNSEKAVPEDNKKKKSGAAASKEQKSSSEEIINELLSPAVLGKLDVQMNVKVDKLLSGSDELGSGSLSATLKQGRFSIDPLKLNIPGGSFSLSATLKPDMKAPQASIRTVMKKFDFGVLVRRTNPNAEMGGLINLDVDLKSSAGSFDKLMANANGYVDFSGRLENLKAGIIDLWAVNLIAAIIFNDNENQSKINCVVGRWTMKNGLLKPDVFLIDTSKIRICGKGQVDFKKEHIDLKMVPTPKKAEYLSLATPIKVNGKFADFGAGIQVSGLMGTYVNLITSPVTKTLQKLFGKELPADGKDVCAMPIGPVNRSAKPPAGCW